MKIVLIVSGLGGGGAERVIATLANSWVNASNSVCVVTLSSKEEAEYRLDSNVDREALGLQSESNGLFSAVFANLKRILAIRKSVRLLDPDVVISFITTTNILSVIACRGLGVPVIVSERTSIADDPPTGVWGALFRSVYRLAECVVVQTNANARVISEALNRPVETIGNPIETDFVEPEDECFDKILGLSKSANILLAVGRLHRSKGFDMLIRAFFEVHRDFSDWQLVIIGDGPDKESLQMLVAEHGLEQRAHLAGFSTAPRAIMRLSRIFVLSSRIEGLPNALMEAMTEGLACISFDCRTGPRELIDDNVNGLLVSPEDVRGLTIAMRRLMNSAQERERLGRGAQLSMGKFNVSSIQRQWDAIIRRVADLHDHT